MLASTSGTVAVSERADEKPDESSPPPLALIGSWPTTPASTTRKRPRAGRCGDAVELVIVNPSLLLGPGDDRLSSTRDVLQFLAARHPD